jgi:hypothetical protein
MVAGMMNAAELARVDLHVDRAAVLSGDGAYRYWLHRRLGLFGTGWCVFVMLNPSTADADNDDPTIRRCMSFAERWGCSGLAVVNLFAFRATKPDDMKRAADPVGLENHSYVLKACELATMDPGGHVVCAWGVHGRFAEQDRTVMGWIEASGARAECLGFTQDYAPRHPLYVPGATQPVLFDLRHRRSAA